MIGTNITHYKITDKLGQGGMGEVYRATDTKLDREVAIKVLPESFAQDRERLARFEREAKTLASLNHPKIAGIYGLEKSGDAHALILELVEGEDLSQRLNRRPLPIDEALDVSHQIAEALEAAHEKNVIHRDLKPGNIKINDDGAIKVLDFGLAKALSDESESLTTISNEDSPTITDAFTKPGTILGTAAYMSPEQARGRQVDKRSDIWAFGCVLFECLTGEKAFQGEDVTETLASIIKGEPNWPSLPPNISPRIEWLIKRCLAKSRKQRLQDIGDARIELEELKSDPFQSKIGSEKSTSPGQPAKQGRSVTLTTVVALIAAILAWLIKPSQATPGSTTSKPSMNRYYMDLDMERQLSTANGGNVKLSPDGSMMAFIGLEQDSDVNFIYIKRFDELSARKLKSTANALDFCFKPDSQWIAFRTRGNGELKKVSTKDGPALSIRKTRGIPRGISWGKDDTLIFGGQFNGGTGIAAVDTEADQRELTSVFGVHYWPQYLPNQRGVIFTENDQPRSEFENARIMVKPLPEGDVKFLTKGMAARYSPSGHIVFVQSGTLFAAAFDLESLSIQGEAIPLNIEVATKMELGIAHFDISNQGTLVYQKGVGMDRPYGLEWIDRNGSKTQIPLETTFSRFRLSPDGTMLAYTVRNGITTDLFIYDLKRGGTARQIFLEDSYYDNPVWSPDGKSLVFSSSHFREPTKLMWARVDETDPPQTLYTSDGKLDPHSWSREGNLLAITEEKQDSEWRRIRILHLSGNDEEGYSCEKIEEFQPSQFINYRNPILSANERWIAYVSNETGPNYQHRIRSFPDGKHPLTIPFSDNLFHTHWVERDQKLQLIYGTIEVFTLDFTEADGQLQMLGQPQQWKNGNAAPLLYRPRYDTFDVDPKGERILVRKILNNKDFDRNHKRLAVFEHFDAYLSEILPPP